RCILVVCLLLIPGAIFGQSIPITGSVTLVDAISENMNGHGSGFTFSGYVGDAADPFGLCYSGQVCDGSALNGATTLVIFTDQLPVTHSYGCLGNVCSPKAPNQGISGILNVTYKFSFQTPTSDQPISIDVPITLSGSLSAIGSSNQTLWTVNISANGKAKLVGDVQSGLLRFTFVTFKYAGTASVVAEP